MPEDTRPTLLVVIASVRPGRNGKAIGDWLSQAATDDGRFEVAVADLAELQLPLMDEPNHPRMRDYQHEHTKAWSATVAAADAVVFVTPEYNFSMIAALKNALDYLSAEWAYLPTGFVSYGGVSGGMRGIEAAKLPMTALRMSVSNANVIIPMVFQMLNDGLFSPTDAVADSVAPMLTELLRLNQALAPLRAEVLG